MPEPRPETRWMRCRPRRLRRSSALRDLVAETHVRREDLIAPLFVRDGGGAPQLVESMPGVVRHTVDSLVEECRALADGGLRAIALFPVVETSLKDERGRHGLDPGGILPTALAALKRALPELAVLTDIALDPYTNHGHDGVLGADGEVDNDATLEILAAMAVMHAEQGSDVVAPSDMMDGRVRALRERLDEAGHTGVAILSYAAKFASSLYGPFRDAVGSASAAGTSHLDKRGYQLEPGNGRQAVMDALLDVDEGADVLMVKPAGWYLDVLAKLRERTELPLAAYQISGEYAQIHAAAQKGWLDLERVRDESLVAIKRAGADWILTYFAKDWLAAH